MAARKPKQPPNPAQVPNKQTRTPKQGSNLSESTRSSSRSSRDATLEDSVGDSSGPRGGH